MMLYYGAPENQRVWTAALMILILFCISSVGLLKLFLIVLGLGLFWELALLGKAYPKKINGKMILVFLAGASGIAWGLKGAWYFCPAEGFPAFGHPFWDTLALVIAVDTGAYYSGRLFKGPRLAPSISPNKTWSGAMGGTVWAACVAGVLFSKGKWSLTLCETAMVIGISQIGDLAESALKRYVGVKDSGTLLPGHGGIADRCDGALFAYGALWLLCLLG